MSTSSLLMYPHTDNCMTFFFPLVLGIELKNLCVVPKPSSTELYTQAFEILTGLHWTAYSGDKGHFYDTDSFSQVHNTFFCFLKLIFLIKFYSFIHFMCMGASVSLCTCGRLALSRVWVSGYQALVSVSTYSVVFYRWIEALSIFS